MSVKETMHRARVVLTPLIPALWLVASVNCLFDPLSSLTSSPPGAFLSASARHPQDASPSASVLDQSARRWSRRLDNSSGPGTPPPVAFGRGPDFHLARVAGGTTSSPVLLTLVQGWQFHWRTAAEPRAPSFVS